MRWPSALAATEALRCSFCRKSQDTVSKLISSPDNPRVYICDECVTVCATILKDRGEPDASALNVEPQGENSPLLSHPLASRFLTSVEDWIRQESLGLDAAEEFAEMRSLAIRMMRSG